mgnify:CR=1 FL=1
MTTVIDLVHKAASKCYHRVHSCLGQRSSAKLDAAWLICFESLSVLSEMK